MLLALFYSNMALKDNILKVITPRATLDKKLDELSKYRYNFSIFKKSGYDVNEYVQLFKSVDNVLLYPSSKLIDELNTSFIDLMRIDYGYRSKRLVPIMIIRNLIDVAAFLYAYIVYEDKEVYLKRYEKGRPLNQFYYKGENLSYGKVIGMLNEKYEGLQKLYRYCCTYVHSGYDSNKAHSYGDYLVDTGYIGFLGKEYKLKQEDFTEWLVEGLIDEVIFDYEEECDMVDACIWVNQILTNLFKEIKGDE